MIIIYCNTVILLVVFFCKKKIIIIIIMKPEMFSDHYNSEPVSEWSVDDDEDEVNISQKMLQYHQKERRYEITYIHIYIYL